MVAVSYGTALLFQHNGVALSSKLPPGLKTSSAHPKLHGYSSITNLERRGGGVTCDGSAPHGALLLGGVKMKELERNLFAYLI